MRNAETLPVVMITASGIIQVLLAAMVQRSGLLSWKHSLGVPMGLCFQDFNLAVD